MAERLTEQKTRKGITKIVVKPFVDMYIVVHKLYLLEDIMEKYGIESVEELGYLLEVFKKMRKQYGKLNQENCKNKRDRDTWERACELACDYMCKFVIPCPDIHKKECENICDYDKARCYQEYFYQQAKQVTGKLPAN